MVGPFLILPLLNRPLRLSTILGGLLVVAIVFYRTRRPATGVVAALGWLCAYEVLFMLTGYLTHQPWSPSAADLFWQTSAIMGWVLLAHALGIRPNWQLVALFAVLWVGWIAVGFRSNWLGSPFVLGDEVWNVATKTVLALAYALGGVELRLRWAATARVGSLVRMTGR